MECPNKTSRFANRYSDDKKGIFRKFRALEVLKDQK